MVLAENVGDIEQGTVDMSAALVAVVFSYSYCYALLLSNLFVKTRSVDFVHSIPSSQP